MASHIHRQQLHFIVIPLVSQGHLIPMTDMARLFAQHGVNATLVTTPLNVIRFKSLIDRAKESGLPLNIVQLKFPCLEANLPEGCENMDTIPSRDLYKNFFHAIGLLQQPFEELLQELKPSPSCLLADKNFAWTAETARKFQIPRILFDGMSGFSWLCSHNLHVSKEYENVSESESFVVPGLPDRIDFTRAQLPGDFNPGSDDFKAIYDEIKAGEAGAYGVVVNTFEELESKYIEGYRKAKGIKVWCVGPVSLVNKVDEDRAQRGNKIDIDSSQCIKWLDSWPPSSVLYACFGSLGRLATSQLKELGLGLEASNKPFIWVVRGDKTGELEKWIQEDGFEERVKGKGLIIRGWAPQVLILSHPAIGGFLTHCGWNSTLEGICAGVPMITWPMFADQFYNEKLIVQVLDIGERVGADGTVHLGEEEKSGVLVKKEQVQEAVDKVISEGSEAKERRKRAKKLSELAKQATENGGSSFTNIELLIEDICNRWKPIKLRLESNERKS